MDRRRGKAAKRDTSDEGTATSYAGSRTLDSSAKPPREYYRGPCFRGGVEKAGNPARRAHMGGGRSDALRWGHPSSEGRRAHPGARGVGPTNSQPGATRARRPSWAQGPASFKPRPARCVRRLRAGIALLVGVQHVRGRGTVHRARLGLGAGGPAERKEGAARPLGREAGREALPPHGGCPDLLLGTGRPPGAGGLERAIGVVVTAPRRSVCPPLLPRRGWPSSFDIVVARRPDRAAVEPASSGTGRVGRRAELGRRDLSVWGRPRNLGRVLGGAKAELGRGSSTLSARGRGGARLCSAGGDNGKRHGSRPRSDAGFRFLLLGDQAIEGASTGLDSGRAVRPAISPRAFRHLPLGFLRRTGGRSG